MKKPTVFFIFFSFGKADAIAGLVTKTIFLLWLILFSQVVIAQMEVRMVAGGIGAKTEILSTGSNYFDLRRHDKLVRTRPNIYSGVSFTFPIDEIAAFNLDWFYSRKGYRWIIPGSADARIRLQVIEFAPQFEYNLKDLVLVSMGFYFGVKLDEHILLGRSVWIRSGDGWIKNFDCGLKVVLKRQLGPLQAQVHLNQGLVV